MNCAWFALSELYTFGPIEDDFFTDTPPRNMVPLNVSDFNYDSSGNVISIDISHRNIEVLYPEHLNYTSLIYLNASYNKLNEIDEFLFYLSPNVEEINFSMNNISKIEFLYDTDYLKELKVLNLSYNQLEYMSFYRFEKNNNLKQIDLRGNRLTIFRCDSENLLTHCASMYFPWDNVEILNMDVGCINPTHLSIIGNDMIYTPKPKTSNGSPCPNLGDSLENILETLPFLNSSIKALTMSGNFIGNLNCTTFQRFSSLENLKLANTGLQDFDCNPFEQLKKLKYFDISGNKFTTLNILLLGDTLKNLDWLSANNNNFTNTAESIQQLGALGPSIKTLELSHTPIGKIDENTFKGFRKLYDLNLENTNLSDFEENPFDGLNELTFINLRNNQLKQPNFNGRVPKLITLLLVNNSITDLNGIRYRNYPRLMGLNVLNNPIPCAHLKRLEDGWWGEFHLRSSCVPEM